MLRFLHRLAWLLVLGVAGCPSGNQPPAPDRPQADGTLVFNEGPRPGAERPPRDRSGPCEAGTCTAPQSCTDSVQNGTETDVDCGGSCPRCANGKKCGAGADCASGICKDKVCAAPSCSDAQKNGSETDVDCGGGSCPKCANGKSCTAGTDCTSGLCPSGTCAAVTCTDGIKNGDETDIDCGGPSCPRCAQAGCCVTGNDCASGVCVTASGKCAKVCAPPSCTDQVKNGTETDVDCGGSCPACAVGKKCGSAADCASGVCSSGSCAAPTCSDAVKNGVETDVDCGGGTCGKCANGKKCGGGGDCASGVCSSGVCAAGSCTDGAKNGTETDIDCGGGCPVCANGKKCGFGPDCASGFCTGGTCVAPAFVGYAELYLKNWGSGVAGATQWNTLTLANRSTAAATVLIKIFRTDGGGLLKSFYKTIPAQGRWVSEGDAAWLAIPDTDTIKGAGIGWIEIDSTQPLIGSNRVNLRSGTTPTSPVAQADQIPIETSRATVLRGVFYLKNWGINLAGASQWSTLMVVNPNPAAATITVVIRRTDTGAVLSTFVRSVPAMGWWNSYGDTSWLAVPNTSATGSLGWVEVSSTQPIFGETRVAIRNGSNFDSPVLVFEDIRMAQKTAATLQGTFFLKNWGSGMTGYTQWTHAIVVNPGTAAATLTVKVMKVDGTGQLASFTKTVLPGAWWNAWGDPDWAAVPDTAAGAGIGWLEISSTVPVFGVNRLQYTSGGVMNGQMAIVEDEPLDSGPVLTRCAPGYFEAAPSGIPGVTQTSYVEIINPNALSAYLTVKLLGDSGAVLGTFNKTVAARAWWNSYGDPDWAALPAGPGWIEVTSTQTVHGNSRIQFGGAGGVVQVDDDVM